MGEMATLTRIFEILAVLLMARGCVWALDEPALNEAHADDLKLFKNIYTMVQSCIVKDDVNVDDCLEMFRGGNLGNEKYQKCKCLIPCVAKYLNMMYTDGTYDFHEIRKMTSEVKSDYFRKEIERVLDICETGK
ncbi:hypothetical protein GE061_019087 [Apolygus lucorum]|uniref:Uncharacterized protein n=1 Tax=Apolygus lucorum TaxID=248454 RepID=A0A8S9X7G7_APOLU|nr:hypothetical protein GE061_019087 [Apolygus lucorum]